MITISDLGDLAHFRYNVLFLDLLTQSLKSQSHQEDPIEFVVLEIMPLSSNH